MPIKVAINGYGRIGRNILRALYEYGRSDEIRIVAVNELCDLRTAAHLTRYDTAHGRFPGDVQAGDGELEVNGDRIRYFSESDPSRLPWDELGVDVVLECTGVFATREQAAQHLAAGARKVLISAPGGPDVDATVVYGVNHDILRAGHTVVSNASCTTNCLAPIVQPLHRAIGIEQGLLTTIHAYTNDQVLTDSPHADLRRARSATLSQVPTKTGATRALGLVLPEMAGRLDGYAMRVPTLNVSMVDLTFNAGRETSVEEVHQVVREAADGPMGGVLAVNDEPLVSIDFNHHPASAVFDATLTKAKGRLVKICAWYDNEWGFANRMLDTAVAMMRAPD
ncbi:glyceraldehyde 3-phosphate dehydrogenase [Alkalispirillum mobile]|uniref:Glyceraldehyde-3-phosphate dehydrogenase n=1 Tax=Alkalispirillum mobile TaxID=85925 RepID=A0A498C1K8_9GAMM|nr:type I glyceraldehyde-3-phosphate dehydrogenase [Alkalispirillum mobile]RLK46301.1 glyceraldehyde 3-phosphate dehydrogenase [Alkalispirillum mobile]